MQTFIKVHYKNYSNQLTPRLINVNTIESVEKSTIGGTYLSLSSDTGLHIEETFEEVEKLING